MDNLKASSCLVAYRLTWFTELKGDSNAFKSIFRKKPKTLPALPVPWLGVPSFLGVEEQPCTEGVSASQVYTAAKWCFCLNFLITHFFFCYLGFSDPRAEVTHTWLFSRQGLASEWQGSAQGPSFYMWSWDWLIFVTMSHFTVPYTNVISCFLTQPLCLLTPCAFHQSALVANASINLILSFFVLQSSSFPDHFCVRWAAQVSSLVTSLFCQNHLLSFLPGIFNK